MLTRCGLQKTWFLWLDGANVSVLCKHSRGTLEDRSKVLFMYSSIRPLKTIFEWFYMIYFVTWFLLQSFEIVNFKFQIKLIYEI